jgi:hypothetical protein
MRLAADRRRVYRTLKARDAERATVEAFKMFASLDAQAAFGRPICGPSFMRPAPLHREFPKEKVVARRPKQRLRPEAAEAQASGTDETNFQTFPSHLLPAFGDLPTASISEQHLARFVAGLKGPGGGSAAFSIIQSLIGASR